MHPTVSRGLRQIALLVLLIPIVACARKPPQEIADANAALERARAACAEQYAASEFSAAKTAVDGVNSLADQRKYGKAKKEAVGATAQAGQATAAAEAALAKARQDAAAAIGQAEKAIAEAEAAQAGTYAPSDLAAARAKLDEARRLSAAGPCDPPRAQQAALAAADLAAAARSKAIAERKRKEEEEAQRKAEEERRRRLEEEQRAAQQKPAPPATYTVQPGDNLWRIAAMADIYADPFQWPLIFKANQSQIKDPDLIYPGQVLKIPRDASREEIEKAIRQAKRRKPGESPFQDGQ